MLQSLFLLTQHESYIMSKLIYYTIHNAGDGSANVMFWEDKTLAEQYIKLDEESPYYEGFAEHYVHTLDLENHKHFHGQEAVDEMKREIEEYQK